MAVFESVLQLMVDTGAYYIFMWLLFAGLIYAVLMKYEMLGDSSAVAGISLGASFFTLLGIFLLAPEGLFLSFSAGLGFAIFGIFGAVIVISMAGLDVTELGETISGNKIAGLGLLVVIIVFIGAFVFVTDLSVLFGDVDNLWREVGFPIVFLIFILIVLRTMTK
jgi:hypothetical protein